MSVKNDNEVEATKTEKINTSYKDLQQIDPGTPDEREADPGTTSPSTKSERELSKFIKINPELKQKYSAPESFTLAIDQITAIEQKGFVAQDCVVNLKDPDGNDREYIAFPIETSNKGVVGYIFMPVNADQNPIDIKIVWRGTKDMSGTIVDAEGEAPAEHAFNNCRQEIMSQINSVLGVYEKPSKITIIGHSLGGALASLTSAMIDCAASQNASEKLKLQNGPLGKHSAAFERFLDTNKKYAIKEENRSNLNFLVEKEIVLLNAPGVDETTYNMGTLAALGVHEVGAHKNKCFSLKAGGDAVQQYGHDLYDNMPNDVVKVTMAKTTNKLSNENSWWIPGYNVYAALMAHTTTYFAKDIKELEGNIELYKNNTEEGQKAIHKEFNTKSKILNPIKIPVFGMTLKYHPGFLLNLIKDYGIIPLLSLFSNKKLDTNKMVTTAMVKGYVSQYQDIYKDNAADAAKAAATAVLESGEPKSILSKFETVKETSLKADTVPGAEADNTTEVSSESSTIADNTNVTPSAYEHAKKNSGAKPSKKSS